MSKLELISAIQQHNPTVDSTYLSSFDDADLDSYLQRLTRVHGRRGNDSVWVRRGDRPAIVTLAPARERQYDRVA